MKNIISLIVLSITFVSAHITCIPGKTYSTVVEQHADTNLIVIDATQPPSLSVVQDSTIKYSQYSICLEDSVWQAVRNPKKQKIVADTTKPPKLLKMPNKK